MLTLKVPNKNCNRRHFIFFYFYLSKEIKLDVSCESSARQRIHKKNQALFSLKDENKNLKCRLLQVLFGALRVKVLPVDIDVGGGSSGGSISKMLTLKVPNKNCSRQHFIFMPPP